MLSNSSAPHLAADEQTTLLVRVAAAFTYSCNAQVACATHAVSECKASARKVLGLQGRHAFVALSTCSPLPHTIGVVDVAVDVVILNVVVVVVDAVVVVVNVAEDVNVVVVVGSKVDIATGLGHRSSNRFVYSTYARGKPSKIDVSTRQPISGLLQSTLYIRAAIAHGRSVVHWKDQDDDAM